MCPGLPQTVPGCPTRLGLEARTWDFITGVSGTSWDNPWQSWTLLEAMTYSSSILDHVSLLYMYMGSVLKFLTPAQTSEMLQWLSMTG